MKYKLSTVYLYIYMYLHQYTLGYTWHGHWLFRKDPPKLLYLKCTLLNTFTHDRISSEQWLKYLRKYNCIYIQKIDARDFDSDVMVQRKSICVLCILGFQHENPINPNHIWHKCWNPKHMVAIKSSKCMNFPNFEPLFIQLLHSCTGTLTWTHDFIIYIPL